MIDSSSTIFVVDDHVDVLTAMMLVLETAGFVAHGFTSSQEALEKLDQLHPDAMLVDFNLPVRGGTWLAEQVQERFGDRIVMAAMSGDDRQGVRLACQLSGFEMFFAKPFRFQDVTVRLCEAIAKRSALKREQVASDPAVPSSAV